MAWGAFEGGDIGSLAVTGTANALELQFEEDCLPVAEPVRRTCELLGFDPLHLANEGRFLAVVP